MKVELPPLPPVEAYKVIADFEHVVRECTGISEIMLGNPEQQERYRSEHAKMLLRLTGTRET